MLIDLSIGLLSVLVAFVGGFYYGRETTLYQLEQTVDLLESERDALNNAKRVWERPWEKQDYSEEAWKANLPKDAKNTVKQHEPEREEGAQC